MNLNQIEYYVAACDAGSISGAAKLVSVTPQTVSSAIASLESELSVELLERNSQGVVATEVGGKVAACGRRVLRAVEDMREAALAAKGADASSLAFIYMPEPLISRDDGFLDAFLREFRFLHPEIRVDAVAAQPDACVHQVLAGKSALGLVSLDPGVPEAESRLVFESRLDLFVPEGHRLFDRARVSFADLAGETLPPISGSSWPTFAIMERCAAYGFKPRFSDTRGSFMEELARGETVGLIPACHSVLETARRCRVIPFVDEDAIPLQARLIAKRGRALSPAARLFADALVEALNDLTGTYTEQAGAEETQGTEAEGDEAGPPSEA